MGRGRRALVGYLPAGFPDVAGSVEALRTMVEHGCDVIEVGLPYSDPVMDGPTIQAAAQQARVIAATERMLQVTDDHLLVQKKILTPEQQRLFFDHIRRRIQDTDKRSPFP